MAGPTIVTSFLADTRSLARVPGQLALIGGNFQQLAAVAAAAFAVDFVSDAIKQASDFRESLNKVNQVFKDLGPSVVEWSKTAAERLGLSQQAALEAAGTFGNLLVALELPADQAANMSEKMVQLAADLGSFNNVPTAKALQAIEAGLVGQTRPLRRFGVNLSIAQLKAEALSTGLIHAEVDTLKLSKAQEAVDKSTRKVAEAIQKHGENSVEAQDAMRDLDQAEQELDKVMAGKVPANLDAATKAQAAYSAMMRQTTVQQGDFARTSDEFAQQTKIMGARWDDMKRKIGDVFLPAAKGVVGFMNNTAIPAIEGFGRAVKESGAFQAVSDVINNFVMPALKSVSEWLDQHGDVLQAAFIGMAVAIGAFLIPVMITLAGTAIAFAASILAAAAPFLLLGAAVAVVAFLIIHNWDTIKAAAAATWDAITRFVSAAWDKIKQAAEAAGKWLSDRWENIKNAAKDAADWIVARWENVKNGVKAAVEFLQPVWNGLLAVWQFIKNVGEQVADDIRFAWEVFGIALALIITAAIAWWHAVVGVWNELWAVGETVVNAIITAWNGLVTGIQAVVTFLQPVWDALQLVWLGLQIAAAATVQWITDRWNSLMNVISIVVQWIIDRWNDLLRGIQVVIQFLQPLWDGLQAAWQGLQDAAGAVQRWIVDRWNDIVNGVRTAVNQVRDFIQGLIDGFHHLQDTVGNVAGDVADRVRQMVQNMTNMIEGIIRGPINAIIRVWNALSFQIPSFDIPSYDLPFIGHIGGQHFGGQTIDFPDLPLLAKGGVLTKPTVFVGGEAGTEIVTPEDLLRTIVGEESGRGGNYTLNLYPRLADMHSIAYGFRRLEMLAGLR